MHKRQVKLKTLVTTLEELGFEERIRGSHGIFSHPKTGLIITLPIRKKDVPSVYLRAAFKQILDRGITSEERLNELLEK
jgi:predicted RNA binding protein YcfA (HicA-like mRNA interferase family)